MSRSDTDIAAFNIGRYRYRPHDVAATRWFALHQRVLIHKKLCAESGMENMDRSPGNNMGKKLDLDCGAPQPKTRNGICKMDRESQIGIFPCRPIRYRYAFFAYIGGRSDMNIGSGQA